MMNTGKLQKDSPQLPYEINDPDMNDKISSEKVRNVARSPIKTRTADRDFDSGVVRENDQR